MKETFEPKTFASWTFRAGTFAGVVEEQAVATSFPLLLGLEGLYPTLAGLESFYPLLRDDEE